MAGQFRWDCRHIRAALLVMGQLCYAADVISDLASISDPGMDVLVAVWVSPWRAYLVWDWLCVGTVILDWACFFLGANLFAVFFTIFVAVSYHLLAIFLSVRAPLGVVVAQPYPI